MPVVVFRLLPTKSHLPMRAISPLIGLLCTAAVIGAAEPPAPDFVQQVAPLLRTHCVKCHGETKQEAGLRLDTGAALIRGGDQGAVIDRQQAARSRLVVAIRGGNDEISRMPPEGNLLSAAEVGVLESWIAAGAMVPAGESPVAVRSSHWSFQPPRWPSPPAVRRADWPRNPIDGFVLAKLESAGLGPSVEADRATLLRRASLDLLGIPPSPEELQLFLADTAPDAYERMVDRLLSAPEYGERWGRHWLDAARYADSNGYTRDFGREIWKYRDWVIAAFNADLPFDRFTIEQFAGDMLPAATLDQQIATGFHRNTLINEEGGTDQEQFRVDAVADRVATTGEVFLGLTLVCARCHSHKYDPVSQREFFQLFACLNNCDEPVIEAPADWQVAAGLLEKRQQIRDEIARLDKQVEERRAELEEKQRAWEKTVTPQQRARLPGPVQVAYDMPFEKRDAANKKTIEEYYRRSEEARRDFPPLDTIAKLREIEPRIPTTLVMRERTEKRRTHVHRRGDFLDPGEEVVPGTLSVLHPLPSGVTNPTRLEFAKWLVDPANPLTPRVIVNRHWQQLFGLGIVETENDFGAKGAPPSHPELLDYLALAFVESGWSVKELHRLIVCSATYRQSSSRLGMDGATAARVATVDPDNKWLWRQNRLRVEAEIVRDMALATSGLLTRKIGGPSVFPPQPEGVFEFTQDPKPWNVTVGEDRYRRGMYTHFWRSSPYPALMVFDAPNGNVTCTRRLRSNTPLQALTLANDEQFLECARGMAERILRDGPPDPVERVGYAFQVALSRPPSDLESVRLSELVQQQRSAFASTANAAETFTQPSPLPVSAQWDRNELGAWTAACRVLLNLDEFVTRE